MKAALTAVPLQFVAFCHVTATNRRSVRKAAAPPLQDPSRPLFWGIRTHFANAPPRLSTIWRSLWACTQVTLSEKAFKIFHLGLYHFAVKSSTLFRKINQYSVSVISRSFINSSKSLLCSSQSASVVSNIME